MFKLIILMFLFIGFQMNAILLSQEIKFDFQQILQEYDDYLIRNELKIRKEILDYYYSNKDSILKVLRRKNILETDTSDFVFKIIPFSRVKVVNEINDTFSCKLTFVDTIFPKMIFVYKGNNFIFLTKNSKNKIYLFIPLTGMSEQYIIDEKIRDSYDDISEYYNCISNISNSQIIVYICNFDKFLKINEGNVMDLESNCKNANDLNDKDILKKLHFFVKYFNTYDICPINDDNFYGFPSTSIWDFEFRIR